jgi:transcription initiation factor TFIIIB Brf1 subunit/transcription initiation factor TFIIB
MAGESATDPKLQDSLIEKMSIYLAKMSMHDSELSSRNPSLLAVGAIYVALKICEQLKRKDLINAVVVNKLI